MKDLLLALLASGGLFSFIQFFITFGFSRKDKTKDLEKQIQDLKEDNRNEFKKVAMKIDYNAAVLARTHILRFNDEILNGTKHSREYWRQQLDDCDTYEQFCKEHPKFKNSYTELADINIKTTYEKLLREGKL